MVRSHSLPRRLSLALALMASALTLGSTSSAQANGVPTWWVATSGQAVGSNGSSCANPSFAGDDEEPIQDAIDAATSGDTIHICSGTYAIGTTIDVTRSLTFTGDAVHLSVLDGGGATRIMDISVGAVTVSIETLQFRNGRVTGASDNGGGIQVHKNAVLNVNDSLFVGNRAAHHGGAIGLDGDGNDVSDTGNLQITDSTFYDNHGFDGGAIVVVFSSQTSTISNSTFVANTATRDGGAINGSFSDVRVSNSTMIDNSAASGGAATWKTTLSGNLVAYTDADSQSASVCDANVVDPVDNVSTSASCLANGETAVSSESLRLGFLAPWGGSTPTYSIGVNSTAIGAVQNNCPSTDQRGVSRSGGNCDAGAFEYTASSASLSASGGLSLIANVPISPSPTISGTGLPEPPVMRVATELTGPLPGGVTFDSETGDFGGTPSSTLDVPWIVVSTSGTDGSVVSARITVDNCLLSSNNGAYLISDADDLEVFRQGLCGLDSDYRQTADIPWNGSWEGPSASNEPFTGTFDGGGHSITGLQMSGGRTAFIAYTEDATIKDFLFSATVTGDYASSGLVRLASNTIIDNVHGSGTISIPVDDGGCHGGIAGETDSGTVVSDSSFTGTINAPTSSYLGGVVACPYATTIIERSFFEGDITGVDDIGGIGGWIDGTDIRDSYAIGSLTATGTHVGGLVGFLWTDYPSNIDIDADGDRTVVTNSFSSMSINGNTGVGSLVGEGESTMISNSFWEEGLSGQAERTPIGGLTDAGGVQPPITATSATDMRSFAFFDNAGWAIVDGWEDPATNGNIWGICDGESRPFLLSHHTSDPCVEPQQRTPRPRSPSAPDESTPPSTSAPSPTVNPSTPPTLATGGSLAYVGGVVVEPTMSWVDNTTIRGTIGPVDFALSLASAQLNSPRVLSVTPGSSLTVDLTGLKPNTSTNATLFSTPMSLGEATVDASGRLSSSLLVPRSIETGPHRLRLEMTAANDDPVTFWLGIDVTPLPLQLPVTGSNESTTVVIALWTVFLGIGLIVPAQRRSRVRRLPSE